MSDAHKKRTSRVGRWLYNSSIIARIYARLPLPQAIRRRVGVLSRRIVHSVDHDPVPSGDGSLHAHHLIDGADKPVDNVQWQASVGPNLSHLWIPSMRLLDAFENMAAKPIADHELPADLLQMAAENLRENPLTVSVIVSSKGGRECVDAAIRSVLEQTYQPLEIFVVDDASDEWGGHGLIKRVEVSDGNVARARNAGLASATGDLIAYLEGECSWSRNYLLVMAAVFAEADLVSVTHAAHHLHPSDSKEQFIPYNRRQLLSANHIDLAAFMHRRQVFLQGNRFDESLAQSFDWDFISFNWDFILACAKHQGLTSVPYVGAEVRAAHANSGVEYIPAKYTVERIRHGLLPLRLAYVVWNWPSLSQSFVIAEVRELVARGEDVIVYFKGDPRRTAKIDFDVRAHRVRDAEQLAELFIAHGRTLCHTHFAYPAMTYLTYPASKRTGIPFTCSVHAVDIFHRDNMQYNLIDQIARDPQCLKLFAHGNFHRRFLEEQGVPGEKIAFTLQAVDLSAFDAVPLLPPPIEPPQSEPAPSSSLRGVFVGRFIEKKGIAVLIEAARLLGDEPVAFDVYGYGPLRKTYAAMLAKTGIDNVRIREPLGDSNAVARVLAEADFLIAPSVVAEDGDTEGFPTVILEAMAAGRPVIASAISAVPDYLQDAVHAILTTPGDADSLAGGVRRLLSMPLARREAMLTAARDFLRRDVGTERTLGTYETVWRGMSVDVFMVTDDTEEDMDRDATLNAIERVLHHTTTPFTLTIMDNHSSPEFRRRLMEACRGVPHIRLNLLRRRIPYGAACNMAIALGDAAHAIHLDGNGAIASNHGWEKPLVDCMRDHGEQAMACYGTLASAREMAEHPEFPKFRNQDFADDHPDHAFVRVDNGACIIRRSGIGEHCAFSELLSRRDVSLEFGYFLASIGLRVGAINRHEPMDIADEKVPPTVPVQ